VVRDRSQGRCIASWVYVVGDSNCESYYSTPNKDRENLLVLKFSDLDLKSSDMDLKLLLSVQQLLKHLDDLSTMIECWHVLHPRCLSSQVPATIRYVTNGSGKTLRRLAAVGLPFPKCKEFVR
jgi:hypothetical protein